MEPTKPYTLTELPESLTNKTGQDVDVLKEFNATNNYKDALTHNFKKMLKKFGTVSSYDAPIAEVLANVDRHDTAAVKAALDAHKTQSVSIPESIVPDLAEKLATA